MQVFFVVFTLSMLLTPAVFMLFYRPRPGAEVDLERIRSRKRLLWGATIACVALYVGQLALASAGMLDWWGELPSWMTFGAPLDRLMWMMFFPLWFALAMPLLVLCRPEAGSPFAQDGPRVATLSSRGGASPIRRTSWVVLWSVWVYSLVAVGVGIFVSHEPPVPILMPILTLVCAVLPLALAPQMIRMLLREPEPLDAAGSALLVDAYATHRRARAWGMYWLIAAMTTLLSAFAVASAWSLMSGATLGIVGGIAGSVVGIGGAAFGVTMGNQRMKIRRLLDELNAQEA